MSSHLPLWRQWLGPVSTIARSMSQGTKRVLSRRRTVVIVLKDATRSADHDAVLAIAYSLRAKYRVVAAFMDQTATLDAARKRSADEVVARKIECNSSPSPNRFVDEIIDHYAPFYVVSCELPAVECLLQFEYRNIPVVLILNDRPRAKPMRDDVFSKAIHEISGIVFAQRSIFGAVKAIYPQLAARACRTFDDISSGSARDVAFHGQAALVDAVGRHASLLHHQAQADYNLIKAEDLFDADFSRGTNERYAEDQDVLWDHLYASKLTFPRDRPRIGWFMRKPFPGFNPLIYATENDEFRHNEPADPLAHYIRNEYPKGPWLREVIEPAVANEHKRASLKIAIHAHLHYPELLGDLLDRLAVNESRADLYLTTTSQDRKETIDAVLSRAGVVPSRIDVVDNVGRDLGPFIGLLGAGHVASYDVIGHVHGKKSPHLEVKASDAWRTFLWEHLIGGRHRMMDRIAAAFARDSRLGLVFPEDPTLPDWDDNRQFADDLAARAGLSLPLPSYFDFPIGSMFWVRPAALKPLIDLNLKPADFPIEPLPVDGTMLHALERLIPFFVRHASFTYATAYVRGVSRC